MDFKCKVFFGDLVAVLYEGEALHPEFQNHIDGCNECKREVESFRILKKNYLSDISVVHCPVSLEKKTLEKIHHKPVSIFYKLNNWLIKPSFALGLILLAIGMSSKWRGEPLIPSPPGIIHPVMEEASISPSEGTEGDSFVKEELPKSLIPLLSAKEWNRLLQFSLQLVRHPENEVPSFAQSAIDSLASFKHELAFRYLVDGDYKKASELLESIIDQNLEYSNWSLAVLDHMKVMRRMGRESEIKKDLEKLKEYALSNTEVMEKAYQLASF